MTKFLSGVIVAVTLAMIVGGSLGWQFSKNFQAAEQTSRDAASGNQPAQGDATSTVSPVPTTAAQTPNPADPTAQSDPTSTVSPVPTTAAQTPNPADPTAQTDTNSGVDPQSTTDPTSTSIPSDTQSTTPVPALW